VTTAGEAFRISLSAPAPPAGLGMAGQALWWDAKGRLAEGA